MFNISPLPSAQNRLFNPGQEDHQTQGPSLSRSRRNIGEPAKYWPQFSTIKIGVYDYDLDDDYVQTIKKAASQWLPHINLKFEFVTGEDADVRISPHFLGNGNGSSSIGTDAKDVSPGSPTMSLPLDHNDPKFSYIVMHEFGHMLGARHAHQHPDAHIPWNPPKMQEAYERAGLSKEGIQTNILPLLRSDIYDFQPYDEDSVMHYEIDPDLTFGEWGQSETWSLSDGDIAWANKAYPKPLQPLPA